MGNKVSTHTGKVVSGFLDVFLADRYRHILVLHNGVCSRCFFKEHFVIFLAVLIQTVISHRNEYRLFKVRFVQAAVVDCDFRGSSAVKRIKQLRVFKEHCFLILTACYGVIDVLKFECLSVLVLADKEDTVLPDSFNRDNALYRFRHDKLLLILLEQVFECFKHCSSTPPFRDFGLLLSAFHSRDYRAETSAFSA